MRPNARPMVHLRYHDTTAKKSVSVLNAPQMMDATPVADFVGYLLGESDHHLLVAPIITTDASNDDEMTACDAMYIPQGCVIYRQEVTHLGPD